MNRPRFSQPEPMLRPDWLLRAGMVWVAWWAMPIGGRVGFVVALGAALACVGRAIWEARR